MRLCAIGLALAVVFGATTAHGEERLLDFVSDTRVEVNGTLDVTETIRLVAEGQEIKHGILRDFPTEYRNRLGGQVKVGFTVLGVTRDGRAEPYQMEELYNGERIRIGRAGSLLDPGEHLYTIHYRTTRQIGFFEGFDELYWNATGTGWTFPIEHAEARITLPAKVPFGNRAVYTGPDGAQGQDAIVVEERPGIIVFRTTRRLEPYEGLTIAAAWAKGVVAAPSPTTRAGWWLLENGALLVAVVGLLVALAWFAHLWWTLRRDPNPRPIVPQFVPPDDMSAALVRLVWKRRFDNRTFAAAIVDAGVRGHLRLRELSKRWIFVDRAIERIDGTGPLPQAERDMLKALFWRRNAVEILQANHGELAGARNALARGLVIELDNMEELPFRHHGDKAHVGGLTIGGTLLMVAMTLVFTEPPASLRIVAGVTAATLVGLSLFVLAKRATPPAGGRRRGKSLPDIVALLSAGLAGVAGIVLLVMAIATENLLPLGIPLLGVPVWLVSFFGLLAPTESGWELRRRIKGFRHYLAMTEEHRLDALHPPEKTPDLFERYLPYAIALNVENAWSRRFDATLGAASMEADPLREETWYVGNHRWGKVSTTFATTLGTSLSISVASAATAPGTSSGSGGSSSSSSSGSSGGGSSGGGGGGGGGGSGW